MSGTSLGGGMAVMEHARGVFVCECCGGMYLKSGNYQKVCDGCRDKKQKERLRAWYEAHREGTLPVRSIAPRETAEEWRPNDTQIEEQRLCARALELEGMGVEYRGPYEVPQDEKELELAVICWRFEE